MAQYEVFETDLMEILWENILEPGSFYFALFTADPLGVGGMDNEADYKGYNRKEMRKAADLWRTDMSDVSTRAGKANNTEVITFKQCNGGSNLITHFAICESDVEGVDDLIYYGSLVVPLEVSDGIIPEFAVGALSIIEENWII